MSAPIAAPDAVDSGNLFRQFAEASEEVFWVAEADSLRVLYASAAFERVWQRGVAEVCADPRVWIEAVLDADKPRLDEYLERQRQRGSASVEYRIRRPDGSVAWIRDRSWTAGDGLVCGIAEDVTVRKQFEVALERSLDDLEARVHTRTHALEQEIEAHRRDAEALRASEERYRALTELSPEGIVIHSGGRIVFANSRAAWKFGAPGRDALVGRDVFSLIHPDCHARVRERLARLYSGEGVPRAEFRFLRLDGTPFDVEVSVAPLAHEGRPAAQVVIRNISERKRAEAQREARNRVLEMLVRGTPREAVLHEIVRLAETQVEGGLGALLLLDPEGMRLRCAAHGSLPQDYLRAIDGLEIGPEAGSCGAAAYRGETVFVEDTEIDRRCEALRGMTRAAGLRACCSVPIVGHGGEVLGVFAVYRRVPGAPAADEMVALGATASLAALALQHWKTLEVLHEREAQLELALEAAAMGSWHWEAATGKLRYSASMGPLLGLPRGGQHASPQAFYAALYPADRERVEDDVRRALKAGAVLRTEYRVRNAVGQVRWLVARGQVTREPGGRARAVFGVVMDMTERAQLEALAEDSQREIERLGRLELLGSMAATLAHELNQPLTAASLTLFGIGERIKGRGRRTDFVGPLEAVAREVARAAAIVSRVREFARRRPLEVRPVPVAALIAEAAELAGAELRRREVRLALEAGDGLTVRGDPVLLVQVLLNLVRNGIEAMQETGAGERELGIGARALDGGGRIELAVTDRGRGPPAEGIEIQIPPFSTRRSDGLGLGLALCRRIIESHGGAIRLEPREGGGTVARVVLPAERGAAA